jgi:hypothetical protein
MAIKVIKHGTKVFRAVCPICGCEFEYEYEDLKTEYGFVREVKCPDCGNMVYHQEYKPVYPSSPTWPTYPNYPYITWTTTGTGTELDCDKCPNKPDLSRPIVGDTPCTWCKKTQPYCYTGDKFSADYKGGIYTVKPESFKDTITTFSNLKTDSTDWSGIKTAYTTNIK